MKLPASLIFAGLLLISCAIVPAHASDPKKVADDSSRNSGTNVNAGLLGQFDGIVEFCSDADPRSARSFRESLRSITSGIRARDLHEARETSSYRQNFKGINSMLKAIPRGQRKGACASMFAPTST